MSPSLRRILALAVTLALGLSLTACGDKDASKASGDSDTSTSAKPAGKPLTRENFSERVFNAIDKAGSAKVHFEAGKGAQKFSGDGEIKYGDELALRVKMNVPNEAAGAAPQQMMMVGETFYISMGDKYMTMPLDAFKSMGVPDISANLDPKVQAKAFGQAVTKFEQSGAPETLDGVQATPYSVTFDPKKAPDVYGTTLTDPVTVVYYIGPDDLLRKMVFADKNGDFISTYSDWGSPVTIEAPPASDLMKVPN
jgi:hypothetical protein